MGFMDGIGDAVKVWEIWLKWQLGMRARLAGMDGMGDVKYFVRYFLQGNVIFHH